MVSSLNTTSHFQEIKRESPSEKERHIQFSDLYGIRHGATKNNNQYIQGGLAQVNKLSPDGKKQACGNLSKEKFPDIAPTFYTSSTSNLKWAIQTAKKMFGIRPDILTLSPLFKKIHQKNEKATNVRMSGLTPSLTPSICLNAEEQPNFGSMRKAYVAGRKEYPEEVFSILKSYVGTNAVTMDLGAGTGIATRQLCHQGFTNVVGVDRDRLMLEEALAKNDKDCSIAYQPADVKKGLPFLDNQFDLVTTFTALHWFMDPASIREIARVIKPKGYFLVVASGDAINPRSFVKYAANLVKGITGTKTFGNKLNNTEEIFLGKNFVKVTESRVSSLDVFTKDEALNNVQSISWWMLIKDTPHAGDLLAKISLYLDSLKDNDGLIRVNRNTRVILLQKLES